MNVTHSAGGAPERTKILIVDDHPVARRGLKGLINEQTDLTVCGEASNNREALDAIAASRPDAAVVDISLRDASGLELIKDIKARYPDVAVLALSMHDEIVYAERALRAGAKGYIMKQETTEEMMKALRHVLAGSLYVSDRMTARIVRQCVGGASPLLASPAESLTDRELEVFELIGSGKTTRESAQALHLSVKTIETHCAHLKEKLGLANSTELLRFAIEWAASDFKA